MINTIQVNNDLSEIKKIREIKEDLKRQKQAEEERIKFNYESQIKELEEREQTILNIITNELEFEDQTKVVCLNGTISKRKVPAKYECSDDLLKELKEKKYNQFIRVKEEVDKVTLKSELIVDKDGKCFTDAGEEIEGVKVVDGGYTWAVKLNA